MCISAGGDPESWHPGSHLEPKHPPKQPGRSPWWHWYPNRPTPVTTPRISLNQSMVLTSGPMQREIHHRELKATILLQTEASRDSDAMHYGFSNRCYSQLFSASKISHSCTFNCSPCLLYSYELQPTMTTSHLVTRDSERHSGKCRETINEDEFDKAVNKRGYVDINFRTVIIKIKPGFSRS